jgi:L-threonylcarbamoyladenylate synthase
MLRETLGQVEVDAASVGPMSPDAHPKAPGMKYRHYAPKAQMTIVAGCHEGMEQRIGRLSLNALAEGKKVGILCTQESLPYYEGILASYGTGQVDLVSAGTRADLSSVAHNLFDALRSFDTAEVDVIYAEAFEDGQLGGAIMNRLQKAAGYHVIRL